MQDKIVIIDLGSKINTNIAREIRSFGVYTEIHPHSITREELEKIGNIKGFILNGGENRIVDGEKIEPSDDILDYKVPMLEVDYNGKDRLPDNKDDRIKVLKEFVIDKCQSTKNWNVDTFIDEQIKAIKEKVGDKKVLLALSGGVDSSVVGALLNRAIGDNLIAVHVNHGLLRKNESKDVVRVFREEMKANLIYVDAAERFISKLEGVENPEEKRKIIGHEFIEVFSEEAKKLGKIEFLGQGTIYPDIIESGTKTSKAVKSHHNVGGLPKNLDFELIEPLKMLFKDEVRKVGENLGLPHTMVYRQPFPGPGLGVRCTGAITTKRLELVRESDAILREEFEKNGLSEKVWQYFTVVPDIKSVGVKDGKRTFEYPCILRAVNTIDAMTAEIEEIDYKILHKITYRITHEIDGINRVLYDITPKPTGTIEWE